MVSTGPALGPDQHRRKIVAYYPSRLSLHRRAEFLSGRDFRGEIAGEPSEPKTSTSPRSTVRTTTNTSRRYAKDTCRIRRAAGDRIPLAVEGAGLDDCHLYERPGRSILHLVNLSSPGAPLDELVPVGPHQVRVRMPEGARPRTVRVSGAKSSASQKDGWRRF